MRLNNRRKSISTFYADKARLEQSRLAQWSYFDPERPAKIIEAAVLKDQFADDFNAKICRWTWKNLVRLVNLASSTEIERELVLGIVARLAGGHRAEKWDTPR